MRALIDLIFSRFLDQPAARWKTVSLAAAVGGSVLMIVDTARLFWGIIEGAVVRVSYIEGFGVSPALGTGVIGIWVLGLVALAVPRTRASFGWLAPVGCGMAAFMDQQTLAGSIMYVVFVATAMHWWSARLATRDATRAVSGAPLRVVQVLVSVVFLWTAFAKLNQRFISGAVLSVSFFGPVPAPEALLRREVFVGLAVATVIAEAFFAGALWIDTLRPFTLVAVLGFHLFIVLFFSPTLALVAFALAMSSGYALFAAEPWHSRRVESASGSAS